MVSPASSPPQKTQGFVRHLHPRLLHHGIHHLIHARHRLHPPGAKGHSKGVLGGGRSKQAHDIRGNFAGIWPHGDMIQKLMEFFSTYSSGSCFQSNFGKKIWVRQKIGSSFPPNFGGVFPSVGSVCRFPSIGWTKSRHPIHNSYSSMVNDPKSPAFRYKKIPIYLTWFQGISTSHSNTTMVPSGMFVLDGISHSRCASESSQGKIKAAISTRTAIDGFYCFLLTGIFSQIVDDFVACPILVGGVFAFFCWYHLKCPN